MEHSKVYSVLCEVSDEKACHWYGSLKFTKVAVRATSLFVSQQIEPIRALKTGLYNRFIIPYKA